MNRFGPRATFGKVGPHSWTIHKEGLTFEELQNIACGLNKQTRSSGKVFNYIESIEGKEGCLYLNQLRSTWRPPNEVRGIWGPPPQATGKAVIAALPMCFNEEVIKAKLNEVDGIINNSMQVTNDKDGFQTIVVEGDQHVLDDLCEGKTDLPWGQMGLRGATCTEMSTSQRSL